MFLMFVLSGIALLFWREYGDSPFSLSRRLALQLTIQATLGPIWMGVMLLIITVPVIFLLGAVLYVGFRKRSFALALLPFALLGAYWLWLVKLISEGAFD